LEKYISLRGLIQTPLIYFKQPRKYSPAIREFFNARAQFTKSRARGFCGSKL